MKVAASLDGKTGLANGQSQWITSEAARADGHAWRARAGAVLTGIGTVLEDNPRLDVRLVDTPRQPHLVVVDSRLQTPPDAACFPAGRPVLDLRRRRRRQGRRAGSPRRHGHLPARRRAARSTWPPCCKTWRSAKSTNCTSKPATSSTARWCAKAGRRIPGVPGAQADRPARAWRATFRAAGAGGCAGAEFKSVRAGRAGSADRGPGRGRDGSSGLSRQAEAIARPKRGGKAEPGAPRTCENVQMFTGIITGVGRIAAIHDLGSSSSTASASPSRRPRVPRRRGPRRQHRAQRRLHDRHHAGRQRPPFTIDISAESLDKTAGLAKKAPVNLEKALRAQRPPGRPHRLGPCRRHRHRDALRAGGRKLGAAHPGAPALGKYLAYKGSITVNGVSLTVNTVADTRRRHRDQHQPDSPHRGQHRPGHA
jgi:hypothetical protein